MSHHGDGGVAQEASENEAGGSGLCVDNSGCVVTKIASLYAERLMSDVTIVVNGRTEYPSHRLILCASSDVFQCMLMNPSWTESRENRVELKESSACANCFEDFLRYFYTGKIQLDFTKIIPLVSLADKYNVCGLLKLGLDFMERNVAVAAKRHQLITWYQFAADSGRHELAEKAGKFIRNNFEIAADTVDFGSLSFDQILKIAARSDIVVKDEMIFFKCLYKWIQLQQEEMTKAGESNVELIIDHYVQHILPLVRFAMMTSSQLAQLLLNPLSVTHTDLLLRRARIAVAYHEGNCSLHELSMSKEETPDATFFTPRLYTAEQFCASISVDHFNNLQAYHCRSLLFSCQNVHGTTNESAQSAATSLSFSSQKSTTELEWTVDVHPKGIWFQKGLLCGGISSIATGGLELPEKVIKTVRISVSSHCEAKSRVRIGLLVQGVQDGFEHIRTSRCRNYIFSKNDQIVHFDDVVDYEDLNSCMTKSNFLTGPVRNSFLVHVIIVPLSERSTLDI